MVVRQQLATPAASSSNPAGKTRGLNWCRRPPRATETAMACCQGCRCCRNSLPTNAQITAATTGLTTTSTVVRPVTVCP